MPTLILPRVPLLVLTGLLALGAAFGLRSQAPANRSTFAVASVKLEKGCNWVNGGTGLSMNPGALRLHCVPVRVLVRAAYSGYSAADLSVHSVQVVGGPAWIDSDTYSIDAKTETAATFAEMVGPMLQSLLAERFRLRIHNEPRDTPVYFLTVVGPGPNLRAMKDGECVPEDFFSQGTPTGSDLEARRSGPRRCGELRQSPTPNGVAYEVYGVTIAELATRHLYFYARRPIVDNTGLKGRFDVHLDFDPRQQGPTRLNNQELQSSEDNSPETSAQTIFTALPKQLGLKLTSGKSPLGTIVVDHVERPSEN
jgi:uncharacterized protein (TIGR03435 family)